MSSVHERKTKLLLSAKTHHHHQNSINTKPYHIGPFYSNKSNLRQSDGVIGMGR